MQFPLFSRRNKDVSLLYVPILMRTSVSVYLCIPSMCSACIVYTTSINNVCVPVHYTVYSIGRTRPVEPEEKSDNVALMNYTTTTSTQKENGIKKKLQGLSCNLLQLLFQHKNIEEL
uniref:Uncharacterized protein n=1 Tax=Cacopsylla melanoneura TaxID=428564 RepID=A0A8D9E8X6_9HEMI